MAESNSKTKSGGIGILWATFIVFLTLKLAEVGVVANWSWWWVFSPIWTPFALLIGGFSIYILATILVFWIKSRKKKKELYQDTIEGDRFSLNKRVYHDNPYPKTKENKYRDFGDN